MSTYAGFFLLLLGLTSQSVFGQTTDSATLSGFVLDASTGEPLPGANIYLSQTLLGSATGSAGEFTVSLIPIGAYEVVASMIGYQPMRMTFQFDSPATYEQTFKLVPVVVNLSEIEVVDSQPKNWKKNVKRFKTLFLGTTKNAKSCELTNPEYLQIEQANRNRFEVSAIQPLIIENNALGYRISYILDSFVADQRTTSFKGLMHFEEMAPASNKDSLRWAANRRSTYNGSLMHFLSALKQGRTEEERFESYTTAEPGSSDKIRIDQSEELIGPGTSSNRSQLKIPRYLEITYTGASEEIGYVLESGRQDPTNQTSWLAVLSPPAEFYSSGLLSNPYAVQNYGYWAWLRVCDMLPIEFGLLD